MDVTDFEAYRRDLTGYCYRMLGSIHDADDAVQDTMLRAWQGWDRFVGEASVRTWLYRIATNRCIDHLRQRRRRLPMEVSGPFPPDVEPGQSLPLEDWIEPALDRDLLPDSGDPAAMVQLRESVRLAFIAALQHLPAKQRAVLILRDVLAWRADEVAALLSVSVASVNSALARARTTVRREQAAPTSAEGQREVDGALLQRYVQTFERYDIDALVALLQDDASMSMPPLVMWFQGREDLRAFYLGTGMHCKGSVLRPVAVNGSPGFAQYMPPDESGQRQSWAIQVIEIEDGQIAHVHNFLDRSLFTRMGLPDFLPA